MRRRWIIGLLTALILAWNILGFPAAWAEDSNLTGAWILSEITIGDSGFSPADVGYSMLLNLRADGTASLTTEQRGQAAERAGTWTATRETVLCRLGDRDLTFRIAEDALISEDGESGMVFRREAEGENAAFALRESFTEEECQGSWRMKYFEAGTELLSAQIMNIEIELEIHPGQVTLRQEEESFESAAEMTAEGLRFMDQYDQERVLRMTESGLLYMMGPWDEGISLKMYFERMGTI